jgi:ubiquinone/menaquinone biosynthesis C-methylase UbiE
MSLPKNEPMEYALASTTERDRLFVQFDIFRDCFRERLRRMLSVAGVESSRPWRALDVACGEGLYAADVVEQYPAATVVGFDRDPEAIATAQAAFGNRARLAFHVGDAHEPLVPLVGTGFDVAFLQLGLSHFKEGSRALNQIRHVIRPGGAIMLFESTEQNFSFPHPSIDVFSNALRAAWPWFGTFAAGDRLQPLLTEAGFVDVTTERQTYSVGGATPLGRANFRNLLGMFSSLRGTLVERARLVSAVDYEEHLARLCAITDQELEGASWFGSAIARKPT